MVRRIKQALASINAVLQNKWYALAGLWVVFLGTIAIAHLSDTESVVRGTQFYEVAAQIIPILLLAAAIDKPAFRGNEGTSFVQAAIGTILTMIVVGEIAALSVIAGAANTFETSSLTIFGLAAAGIVVLALAITGQPAGD